MDITGLGSAFDFANALLDRFWPKQADELERMGAVAKIAAMTEARDAALAGAQKEIIVAEMNQGDKFTKRARPMVVYAGLGFIFLVHVFLPMFSHFKGTAIPTLSLPQEFWWAWSSVVGIWAIGRSCEKYGASNKLISTITGNNK